MVQGARSVRRKQDADASAANASQLISSANQSQNPRRPVLGKSGASRSSRTLGAGCDGRGGAERRTAPLLVSSAIGPSRELGRYKASCRLALTPPLKARLACRNFFGPSPRRAKEEVRPCY